MSGQPIEKKAHHSRSCRPWEVSRTVQEEGTWTGKDLTNRYPCPPLWTASVTADDSTFPAVMASIYQCELNLKRNFMREKKTKNNGPFCSACMCLPRCREPTQLHARPQPSFQISVTDPAEQKISGEVHIYKVKLVPQQVQCLLKQKVTSMHLLMWAIHSCFSVAVAAKTAKDLPLQIKKVLCVLAIGGFRGHHLKDPFHQHFIFTMLPNTASEVHLVHRSQPFLNCPSSSKDFNLTSSRGIKCCKMRGRFWVYKVKNVTCLLYFFLLITMFP